MKLNLVLGAKRIAHLALHDAKAGLHLFLEDPKAAAEQVIRKLQ
ncbi:MAG: hypothetical protein ACREFY_15600 [Acetobacteraceae bacterium]